MSQRLKDRRTSRHETFQLPSPESDSPYGKVCDGLVEVCGIIDNDPDFETKARARHRKVQWKRAAGEESAEGRDADWDRPAGYSI